MQGWEQFVVTPVRMENLVINRVLGGVSRKVLLQQQGKINPWLNSDLLLPNKAQK